MGLMPQKHMQERKDQIEILRGIKLDGIGYHGIVIGVVVFHQLLRDYISFTQVFENTHPNLVCPLTSG